ncbi:hypothetical protein DFH28DRAFT_67330 [Melampsora americana]|nr:hypothetical protein DFH28DRAFT_67330 [Melampsora americana]
MKLLNFLISAVFFVFLLKLIFSSPACPGPSLSPILLSPQTIHLFAFSIIRVFFPEPPLHQRPVRLCRHSESTLTLFSF